MTLRTCTARSVQACTLNTGLSERVHTYIHTSMHPPAVSGDPPAQTVVRCCVVSGTVTVRVLAIGECFSFNAEHLMWTCEESVFIQMAFLCNHLYLKCAWCSGHHHITVVCLCRG